MTGTAVRRDLRPAQLDLLWSSGLAIAAGAAGYLVVRDPRAAVALAIAPAAVWLFAKRRVACIMLGGALPFAQDVSGGRLGVNLALSDLLMVVILASVLVEAFITHRFPAARALRPLRWAFLPYIGFMVVLLAFHLGVGTFFKTGQRLELFLVPLVIGAVMALEGSWLWALRAYVVASTVLAAAWPFIVSGDQGLGIQKNPAGQFIANALLLIIAVKPLRSKLLLPTVPVLIGGLLLTQSRGAILSVGVGLIALLLVQAGGNRRRLLVQLVPLSAITVTGFFLLPDSVQERNTTFSAGTGSDASYAIEYRKLYHADAWNLIHAHPMTGVGVGQYRAGSDALHTTSTDPHQVLLFQAAEGGYLLAALFGVLIVGTLVTVAKQARRTALGPAAVAVTAAIVSHGFVDVYWVRGTPVLGWLLIGMALAQCQLASRTRRAGPA